MPRMQTPLQAVARGTLTPRPRLNAKQRDTAPPHSSTPHLNPTNLPGAVRQRVQRPGHHHHPVQGGAGLRGHQRVPQAGVHQADRVLPHAHCGWRGVTAAALGPPGRALQTQPEEQRVMKPSWSQFCEGVSCKAKCSPWCRLWCKSREEKSLEIAKKIEAVVEVLMFTSTPRLLTSTRVGHSPTAAPHPGRDTLRAMHDCGDPECGRIVLL